MVRHGVDLARLDGGKEAVHALSAPYPQYSHAETEQKIAHALKAAGPHTCAYIQGALGFTGCPVDGCGVRSPAALGVSHKATRLVEAYRQREEDEVVARAVLARLGQPPAGAER